MLHVKMKLEQKMKHTKLENEGEARKRTGGSTCHKKEVKHNGPHTNAVEVRMCKLM